MSIRSLSYFLTAAEEMNFTTAAQKLYITQQTLSSHIQRLEQEYGVALFNRRPRLSLTPEGERMVRYATRIVRMERIMSSEFADISQKASGILMLGSSRIRAKYYFPLLWQAYQNYFPNIEIRLTEGNSLLLEKYALEHKVDMCIGINIPSQPRLHTDPLSSEKVYFVITRQLFEQYFGSGADIVRQKYTEGFRFSDIIGIPLILLPPNNRIRRMVDQEFEAVDVIPRAVFESNDNELIFNMCVNGCGAAFLSESFLFYPFDMYRKNLSNLYAFPLDTPKITTVIAYPSDLELPHYAQVFVNICRQVFSESRFHWEQQKQLYEEAILQMGGSEEH